MPNLLFAMPTTNDPEELLEAALMWKALRDEYGPTIHPLKQDEKPAQGDMVFGLATKAQFACCDTNLPIDYWNIPAFRNRLTRSFKVCNFEEADAEVERLRAEGKGFFLKALRDKYYTGAGGRGETLWDVMGSMIYSFCDQEGPCLMVQERVSMSHEVRFSVIDGEVVAESPVLHRATPASILGRELRGIPVGNILYAKPDAALSDFEPNPRARHDMRRMAQQIAAESGLISGTIDIALLDEDGDRIEPIEMNIGYPGRYGLYFCDPVAIAKASRRIVPPELLNEVRPRPEARPLYLKELVEPTSVDEVAEPSEAPTSWCDHP